MLKILQSVLRGSASGATGAGTRAADGGALYEMLFCDELARFAPATDRTPAPWQALLYAPAADPQQVLTLAQDEHTDPRVRALAWCWLRDRGHAVPAKQLLGVVFEVPMQGGNDTLAAYRDGSVRLLHHAGPPALFEGPIPMLQPSVQRVFNTAQPIVDRIGPTDQPRRPPPPNVVRLNFIVSDGLYFGQGPMQALQGDAMAGPLLAAGAELLGKAIEMALHQQRAA